MLDVMIRQHIRKHPPVNPGSTMEIMDWLDKAVYEGEYYDSLTEAVKWAILYFVRGERNPISGGDEYCGAYAGVCQGFCQAE